MSSSVANTKFCMNEINRLSLSGVRFLWGDCEYDLYCVVFPGIAPILSDYAVCVCGTWIYCYWKIASVSSIDHICELVYGTINAQHCHMATCLDYEFYFIQYITSSKSWPVYMGGGGGVYPLNSPVAKINLVNTPITNHRALSLAITCKNISCITAITYIAVISLITSPGIKPGHSPITQNSIYPPLSRHISGYMSEIHILRARAFVLLSCSRCSCARDVRVLAMFMCSMFVCAMFVCSRCSCARDVLVLAMFVCSRCSCARDVRVLAMFVCAMFVCSRCSCARDVRVRDVRVLAMFVCAMFVCSRCSCARDVRVRDVRVLAMFVCAMFVCSRCSCVRCSCARHTHTTMILNNDLGYLSLLIHVSNNTTKCMRDDK